MFIGQLRNKDIADNPAQFGWRNTRICQIINIDLDRIKTLSLYYIRAIQHRITINIWDIQRRDLCMMKDYMIRTMYKKRKKPYQSISGFDLMASSLETAM